MDVSGGLYADADAAIRTPFLQQTAKDVRQDEEPKCPVRISAHRLALAISGVQNSLAPEKTIRSVWTGFAPVSQSGQQGIDELKRQTTSLWRSI